MFRPVQFGKYYLTERIAVGGMAELFKAKLFGVSGFEKPMVVKQILPKYSRNAEFVKMFIDEAKIAVTLTHGNIVPVYELGRINGIYFIAMEYIHGKDLAEILETARSKGRPLSAEHAIFIAIEICKGLDYAHRRTDPEGSPLRVVHRDISPPNVLVSMEGDVKITDFGIAKASDKLGSTEAGVVKGTFGYMSPEQVRGLPLDYHTDIFSAGILLHEMLTGRRLFTGDSELEAIERVKAARIPAPSAVNSKLPSAIDPIVFKALAKDPADRFADANEFQLALSRFLFTAGKGATASSLSRYMHEVFDDEPHEEVPQIAETESPKSGLVLNEGELIAARPDFLEELTAVGGPPPHIFQQQTAEPVARRRPAMDVGAGASVAVNSTLALPSLAEQQFAEDDRTAVFKGARQPQRPEVPVLHFPPKQEKKPAPRLFGDFPSAEELASLADGLEEPEATAVASPQAAQAGAAPVARPAPPSPAAEPDAPEHLITIPSDEVELAAIPTEEVQLASPSQEIPDLMGLMTRPPTGAQSAMAARPASVSGTAQTISSGLASVIDQPQKKKVSGIVSATMRLFVEGLDDEVAYPLAGRESGAQASFGGLEHASGSLDDDSSIDEIPRTIKPTVLGWLIILVVVLGATSFVLYKKTNLFGRLASDEDASDTLRPEDIRKEVKKDQKRGTVVLTVKPAQAAVFRFVGEAPVSLERLDQGQSHLVRAERDGFRTVYQTITPKDLASGKAELKLSLSPIGTGSKEELPQVETTPPTGKLASARISSDPPMAMIWVLVGRGEKVELHDIDTSKSLDFKVILPGYQAGLAHISSVDFANKQLVATTVTLEKEGAATPTDGGAAAKPDVAKPDTAAVDAAVAAPDASVPAKVFKKVTLKVAPKPKPKIKVRHVPLPKGKKAPAVKKTKKVPVKGEKKGEKKPASKLPKLPDWAK